MQPETTVHRSGRFSALVRRAERSPGLRYGVAVAAVVGGVLLRLPLQPLLGDKVPFLFFFPAVMLAGWFGGLGPGLLATALAAVMAEFFFYPPALSLRFSSLAGLIQIGLFMVSGVLISSLTESLHRMRSRAEAAARESRSRAEERARFLEEAEAARRSAEEASRAKDQFLATVSHELRTPLNAILGWAQLLQAASVDPERLQRGLETIVRNSKLQAQLIDDLLDVSRIVSGKMRLDVREVDLVRVIESSLEAVRPAAEAKQIHLWRVLDPLAGPVAGDPDRLQQVVWNLLSNAVKFTPKGGKVEVRLARINSHVEILVADTGSGISPEFLPHVFDRFRQRDSSSTRQHGGLGLGLAIVRHLTELHGGTVQVTSPGEGRGTTFVVQLPCPIAQLASLPGEEARVHPTADSEKTCSDDPALNLLGLRVLVVDDEADARETLEQILRHCDAEVRTAASAAEALPLLQAWRPHVLLSDIGMPGEDGYSLIRRVRELPPERGGKTPAVALTAFARSEDRRRALSAGFQMHLAKPVEINELATVVVNLVGR
jgi:signal transduction histidine kinase